MRKLIIALCACAGYQVALSQELDSIQLKEVVILSTRNVQPLAEVGKTTYLLTEKDLKQSPSNNVSELLQTLPGIFVTGAQGPEGSTLGYFNRGASSSHTLVLVDGKPLNDPSFPSRLTDLRHIPLSMIESVEVLQGGLSTLYGSGASASVINITTKSGDLDGIHGSIGMEGGSFSTFQPSAHISVKQGRSNTDLNVSHRQSKGFSSALPQDPTANFDDDGFNSWDARLSSKFKPNDQLEFSAGFSYNKFEADYDGGAFFDAENISKGELMSAFGSAVVLSNGGETQFDISFTETDRSFDSAFPAAYAGRELNSELRHTRSWGAFDFLGGVALRTQSALDPFAELNIGEEKNQMIDGFMNSEWNNNGKIRFHGGIRTHSHSEYGTYLLYHLNPVFYSESGNRRFKAFLNYSNSYLAPSLSQLYSPWGSTDLIPETTQNAEISFLYGVSRWEFSLSAFNRNTNNFIAYGYFDDNAGFVGQLFNLDTERTVRGIEGFLRWSGESVNGTLSYSNASSDDSDHLNADMPVLLRVPSHQWKALIGWSVNEDFTLGFQYQYISPRTDFDWNAFSTVDLDSYHLLGLKANYDVGKFTIYGLGGNLLDSQFQNVLGFQTRGRNFTLGARFDF